MSLIYKRLSDWIGLFEEIGWKVLSMVDQYVFSCAESMTGMTQELKLQQVRKWTGAFSLASCTWLVLSENSLTLKSHKEVVKEKHKWVGQHLWNLNMTIPAVKTINKRL